MRRHSWRYGVGIAAIWLICALGAGCSSEAVEGPDEETYVNPDKPNANDMILHQATLGHTGHWSYIGFLKPESGGGYYFAGGYDSDYGIGLLSSTGGLSWFTDADFAARDMVVLSPSAAAPNGLVAVGGIDTDGDNESEIGYVSLYGSSGSLLDHVLYTSDTSDVWINAIAPLSDSTFVVVGGVRTAAAGCPFVGTVAVTSPGQVEKREHCTIDALPGRLFDNVVVDPLEQQAGELVFYASSEDVDFQTYESTIGIHKVTVGLPGLTSSVVDWNRDIVTGWGLGTYALSGRGLGLYEGNLYLVGSASDPTKLPAPSSGGYWDSGLAAALTPSGGLRWSTTIALTNHDDYFEMVAVGPTAVYAVGGAGDFVRSGHHYGYGLVSKLAVDTGDTLASMTFGEDVDRSGFLSGVLSNNVIHCGGWTGYEVTGGGYVGWFCEIDMSNPLITRPGPTAVPAVLGDAIGAASAREGDPRSDPCGIHRSN